MIALARAGCKFLFGAWLSLVERLVRDQEVRSSNLRAPTILQLKMDLLRVSTFDSLGIVVVVAMF